MCVLCRHAGSVGRCASLCEGEREKERDSLCGGKEGICALVPPTRPTGVAPVPAFLALIHIILTTIREKALVELRVLQQQQENMQQHPQQHQPLNGWR